MSHDADYERARSALQFISPEDRDTWVRMAMALKDGFGDQGFDIWNTWSRQSDRYNERDAADVWRSAKFGGGITLATLFYEAKVNGNGTRPTREELTEQRRVASERAARERDQAKEQQAEASRRAALIWNEATPAPDSHAYLVQKGIKPHNLRVHKDRLLVPMQDGEDLCSLQFISDEGGKVFLKGGRVSGCYHLIDGVDDTLCVAEGFATGASVHESTGHAVAVAFNAGNLKPVALAMRERFPNASLIVCADNDAGTPGNPGLAKARAAAAVVGAALCCFPEAKEGLNVDFNDIHREHGAEAVRQAVEGAEVPVDAEERTIRYEGGVLPRNLDEAESALLAYGGVYQRGSLLVRVARISEPRIKRSVQRGAGALTIVPLDKEMLVELLTDAARWEVLDRKGEFRAANCPRTIAAGLLSRIGRWRFPVLAGIAEAPYMMDGQIYDKPGYDPDTGAYLDLGEREFPDIPREPTQRQAKEALRMLEDVVKDFPFLTEVDVSVWLGALLTPFVRLGLRSTPLFGFSAPVMASGKSLLVDLVSLVATGRRAAVMSHAEDPNEEKKRLLSVLIEGDAIIAVDNIGKPWVSDTMSAILTAETYKDRLLGVNKSVTVPTAVTWCCTGNNLTFAGDLSTRVLVSRLDPGCERPEERPFDRDLLSWVPEHRPLLVAACLTVLRGYAVAGYPNVGLRPFGRFEEWSSQVRSSLVWLGQPDPCLARKHTESADPVKQSLGSVLSAWWVCFSSSAKTVSQVVSGGSDELREALLGVAGDNRDGVNTRRLGNWLSKYEGRVVDGLKFQRFGDRQKIVLWQVVSLYARSKDGVFGGFGGFAPNPKCADKSAPRKNFTSVAQTHQTPQTHRESCAAEEPKKQKTQAECGSQGGLPVGEALTCPRCAGEGCGWCGRLVDDEAEVASLEPETTTAEAASVARATEDLTDADYQDDALSAADEDRRRREQAEPGYLSTAETRYCSECLHQAVDRSCRSAERLGAPKGWKPRDGHPRRCQGFRPKSDGKGLPWRCHGQRGSNEVDEVGETECQNLESERGEL